MERGTVMEINYKDIGVRVKQERIKVPMMKRGTFMEINYKDIGIRIKQERINQNITQEKLAEITGISVTHMSNIENANTKLSLPVLVNIANALNCDANIILFGNTNSNLNASLSMISKILSDCSSKERIIIIDTIQALKNSLKNNRKEVN